MHKVLKLVQVKPQIIRSQGATHKVLKSTQVNTQMEQTQRAKPKLPKLVLVEPQVPRVVVCPTKVGYGGRGKKLPGAKAVLRMMGRVALATCPKHVALAALPGTMAPRVVAPEAVGPHVETCAPQGGITASASIVDVPLIQTGTAVEMVETLPQVAPGRVVETRGASDVMTMSPTSRQQAPVASVKGRSPNNNTLVKSGARVPKTRTKVSSLPVTTPVRWRKPSEVVPCKLLDNRNCAMLQRLQQNRLRSQVQSSPAVTYTEVHQEDIDLERESISDVSGEGYESEIGVGQSESGERPRDRSLYGEVLDQYVQELEAQCCIMEELLQQS